MKRRIAAILGVLATAGLTFAFFQDEANWYAVTNSSGSISSGRKFGVDVGVNIEEARRHLQGAGFTQLFSPLELEEMNYPIRGEYVFSDSGWRRGTVWLRVSGRTVTAISWHYQLGAP